MASRAGITGCAKVEASTSGERGRLSWLAVPPVPWESMTERGAERLGSVDCEVCCAACRLLRRAVALHELDLVRSESESACR